MSQSIDINTNFKLSILEYRALLEYLKITINNDSLSSIARNKLDRTQLLTSLVKLQMAVDEFDDGMKYTE